MKVRRGLYYLLNLFLPLSELKYTKNRIVPSLSKQFQRVRVAYKLSARHHKNHDALSWSEAIAASGCTIDELNRQFRSRRRLYLIVGYIPLLLSVGMICAIAISGWHSPALLIRAAIMIMILTGLSSLPFMQAMICTWRLWQLHEHRVSESEKGTFKSFCKETRWLRNTLSPWH